MAVAAPIRIPDCILHYRAHRQAVQLTYVMRGSNGWEHSREHDAIVSIDWSRVPQDHPLRRS